MSAGQRLVARVCSVGLFLVSFGVAAPAMAQPAAAASKISFGSDQVFP